MSIQQNRQSNFGIQANANDQPNYSSQERVLKMAEEEEDVLDDAIAQNQKHNIERNKKKSLH